METWNPLKYRLMSSHYLNPKQNNRQKSAVSFNEVNIWKQCINTRTSPYREEEIKFIKQERCEVLTVVLLRTLVLLMWHQVSGWWGSNNFWDQVRTTHPIKQHHTHKTSILKQDSLIQMQSGWMRNQYKLPNTSQLQVHIRK